MQAQIINADGSPVLTDESMINPAIISSDINFSVKVRPVFVDITGTGKMKQAENARSIVRDDTGEILSIMGGRYTAIDHRVVISAVHNAVSKLGKEFKLTNRVDGARVYSRFTFEETFLNENEKTRAAIELYNSYDGTTPFAISFSLWRQVCANGAYGFGKELELRKMHTPSLNADSLISAFGFGLTEYKERYIRFYNALKAEKPIDRAKLVESFSERAIKNSEGTILEEVSSTGGLSAWTQYNGMTRVITHKAKISERHKQETLSNVTKVFMGFFPTVAV